MTGKMNNLCRIGFVLCIILSGCDQANKADDNTTRNNNTQPSIQHQSPVLVTVNGEPITEAQLEYAMTRTLGESAGLLAGPEVQDKVLQSLVQSRAIAQQAQKELSEQEAIHMEEQVRAYREELLVKRYLQNHAEPQPVSNKQVKEYYEKNPELFGGEVIRKFEYLTSVGPLADLDREKLVTEYQKYSAEQNWKHVSASLVEAGFPVKYKQAEMNIKLLPAAIKELVTKAKVAGNVETQTKPDVIMLRVLEERITEPKPLQTVSSDIRKTLAHKQMKEAVKSLAGQVMSQAKIEKAAANQQ